MYSSIPFPELVKNKDKKELVFIHSPKCAGSYVSRILSHLEIKNFGHQQAIPNENYIYFTVIRDPVDRFESWLNFCLSNRFNFDWPINLLYSYYDKNITLDEIISKMTDRDMLQFKQYRSLNYWTKNVEIIITIDNLSKMLECFGYTYDINSFKPINVSDKLRGRINEENRNRIKKIFNDDVELYNKVIDSKIDI
jgi:hypothetical protein